MKESLNEFMYVLIMSKIYDNGTSKFILIILTYSEPISG